MVDMDYLNIDMNICQLLLLHITTKYKELNMLCCIDLVPISMMHYLESRSHELKTLDLFNSTYMRVIPCQIAPRNEILKRHPPPTPPPPARF